MKKLGLLHIRRTKMAIVWTILRIWLGLQWIDDRLVIPYIKRHISTKKKYLEN
jgi:hypothetical protein